MKKLVTVVWSVTVAVDVPEDFNEDNAESYDSAPEIGEAAKRAIDDAWGNVQKNDGIITSVEE